MEKELYTSEITEEFLNLYNDLDDLIGDGQYSAFVKFYDDRINNLRRIRNLAVHASYQGKRPFLVSIYVLNDLKDLLRRAKTKCIDVAIKKENIKYLKLTDPISKAVKYIIEDGFSCLPIVDNGFRVIGAVTSKGLVSIMHEKEGSFMYDNSITIGSEIDNFSIVNNPRESFIFKAKQDLFEYTRKEVENLKTHFSGCFITEHGSRNEALEGLFTMWDVRHYL